MALAFALASLSYLMLLRTLHDRRDAITRRRPRPGTGALVQPEYTGGRVAAQFVLGILWRCRVAGYRQTARAVARVAAADSLAADGGWRRLSLWAMNDPFARLSRQLRSVRG